MCLAGGCVAEAIVGTGRQSVRKSLKNVLGTKRGRGYRLLSNTWVYELGDSFGPVHRHLQRATMALPSKAA